ncbi:TetR family transcriptional regulator [Falsirhodobacter sp. 1013]|uniref:TetR family transcriptional regulator n=1 Tax=Falsirhodobacter sp. 1013 TaxID=3417566 RepID=UPI003EB9D277
MRRTRDDAEATRQAIMDAAETVFLNHGIANTSLEKVSRAAGVTRGAFYWHFKDKSELLRALNQRVDPPQAAMARAAAAEGHDDPLALIESVGQEILREFEGDERRQRMFEIVTANLRALDEDTSLAEANADVFTVLTQLMTLARDQGQLDPDFTPQEAAFAMMITMNGVLAEWLRAKKSFALFDLGGKLIRQQIRSLRVG